MKKLLIGILVGTYAAAVVVNGLAAEVAASLITIRQVQYWSALRSFMEGSRPKWLEKDALGAAVDTVVRDEILLRDNGKFVTREKKNFAVATEKKIRELKAKHSDEWRWILREFKVSEAEATERATLQAIVDRIVDRKAATFTVSSPPEKDSGEGNDNPVERSVKQMAAGMRSQRIEKGLEQWIAALKETYQVKIYWDRSSH